MAHIPYRRVEAYPLAELPRSANTCLTVVSAAAVLALIGVFAYVGAFVILNNRYTSWNSQNIKTLNAVPPDAANNLDIQVVSPGLVQTLLPATNTHVYENDGVVKINSLSSDPVNRNIDIVGTAPAITVVSAVNTVTVSSPAVVTINGNSAVANDFVIAAGTGIGVATVGNTATVSTPALLTINGNAGVLNNFVIAAGAGIGVATVGNTATVSTPAVLTINSVLPAVNNFQLLAGAGLAVANGVGSVTYSDIISAATLLDDTDVLGPLVRYESAIGFFVPVPENSGWRTGLVPGFPQSYIPGAVSGDSGLGDLGGTGWAVPAIGTYTVNADCELFPSAVAVNDMQVVHVALSLGATSEDPLALAIVPSGGFVTLDISGGTNANVAPPTLPRRASLSTTFQAGCTSCAVQVGDALQMHVSMERTGVQPGPYTVSAYCSFQVATVR